MIYNTEDSKTDIELDMHKVMEVFVSQMRLLLNVNVQVSEIFHFLY